MTSTDKLKTPLWVWHLPRGIPSIHFRSGVNVDSITWVPVLNLRNLAPDNILIHTRYVCILSKVLTSSPSHLIFTEGIKSPYVFFIHFAIFSHRAQIPNHLIFLKKNKMSQPQSVLSSFLPLFLMLMKCRIPASRKYRGKAFWTSQSSPPEGRRG